MKNVTKSKNWLFQDEYCWWKMWAFASEVSSADAKCEDLSYETGDKMEILGVCVKK